MYNELRKLIETASVAIILMSFACNYTYAQCEKKIYRIDPGHEDEFGRSVDIDGDIAIVGAWLDDSGIIDHGSAYLFNATTGNQIYRLIQSDPLQFGYYGYSTAIQGSTAIVGAFGEENTTGEATGAAYLFDTSTGLQVARLLASDGKSSEPFGISVDISDTAAIIGAVDTTKGAGRGSAYLFDISSGQQEHKLLSTDGEDGDQFGFSVAISEDFAIVGAYLDSTDFGGNTITHHGSVYVFDPNTGVQITKLVASDMQDTQHFGQSVAISGSIAIIGAPTNDIGDHIGAGSAYLFDLVTGQQIAILSPADRGSDDGGFGWSVAIDSDRVIVGTTWHNHSGVISGTAYLYGYDSDSAWQIDELLSHDRYWEDDFGLSVGISGDKSIVGAPHDFYDGAEFGSAYIFDSSYHCPTLSVSPDPLEANASATFTVNNAKPSTNTYLVYSLQGLGSTYSSQLNVTIDLDQPVQADGPVTSDGDGFAQWVLSVPPAGAGHDVWFQSLQFETKTNVVATTIVN